MTVTVLFAREDSVYKTLPMCDVYDRNRDARSWLGGAPVIAHPPCAQWGRLRRFAHDIPEEKFLAYFAVSAVQTYGGVLEHPAGSLLWPAAGLPYPGDRDKFGGWTLAVPQMWWGHRAEKATWVYIVGVEPGQLPPIPFVMGEASHVVQSRMRSGYRPHISKAEREQTPRAFAEWLCDVASRAKVKVTQ